MNYLVMEPNETIFTPADGVYCYPFWDIVEYMACSYNILTGELCLVDCDSLNLCSGTLRAARLPAKPGEDGTSGHILVYQSSIDKFEFDLIDMPAGNEVFHATLAVAILATYELKPRKFLPLRL